MEEKGTVDDAGDELAVIDDAVASLLKFFDDSAIKVRSGTGRDYTAVAQRLRAKMPAVDWFDDRVKPT